jgi:ABC-2 type transport system permease protein
MPIFDQGYQHWQGTLSGHGLRWLTVARHGARAGMQNRLIRVVLIFAWLPALALVGVLCLWGMAERQTPWAVATLAAVLPSKELLADPADYRMTLWSLAFHYFLQAEMFFVMILVMLVGPGLISQDLRFNALPLYFSRPVRRGDYFLGKLGVIGYFLGLVTVGPAVAAWLLGGLFSLDFGVFLATGRILFGVIVYGLTASLSAGLLMLALSSLSRNSRYVAISWAGLWLITGIVSTSLRTAHEQNYYLRMFEADRGRRFVPVHDQAAAVREAEESRQARRRVREELAPSFENDWRPLVSYPQNLLRLGDALIGTDEARDRFDALRTKARTMPARPAGPGRQAARQPYEDDYDLMRPPESRWPWYWSAAVLLALAGASLWILHTRVKTLDRLR